jgi:hypothetical protein
MFRSDYSGVNIFLKYVDYNRKKAFCSLKTFVPIIIFISPRGSYGKKPCNLERAVAIFKRSFSY